MSKNKNTQKKQGIEELYYEDHEENVIDKKIDSSLRSE